MMTLNSTLDKTINMDKLVDAHYFMLPTQGNIYTLTLLNLRSSHNKFIVGSLKKKIFSFEYIEGNEASIMPIVKEISWTYIPSGVEVIAIDAFNKSNVVDDFQIAIAIAKQNPDGRNETYLNIYSEEDLDNNIILNIDSVAQNCLMIELNFIPYHLTHTVFFDRSDSEVTTENVWLLSGNDMKIHVYREDHQNHSYVEEDATTWFPEFKSFTSIVMWIDVVYDEDHLFRYSAVGCEDGTLLMYLTSVTSNMVLVTHEEMFVGTITRVKLFTLKSKDFDPPEVLVTRSSKDIIKKERAKGEKLNLLVCCTEDPPAVYMDVGNELKNKHILDGIPPHDLCLCGCIADINMDGRNEILLGTYEQLVLMYSWDGLSWNLGGQRKTSSPVQGIEYADLTGDGVNELIVQTLSGVHVMQYDPVSIHHMLYSRLVKLLDVDNDEEIKLEAEVPKSPPVEKQDQEESKEEEDDRCEEACEH